MGELDGWRHCPQCAAAVQAGSTKVECAECGFVVYASSKPTASALVVDEDGRVMLSRRARDPFAGLWDLPGGFLEEGEHPVECLHRELREEAGIGLRDLDFIGIYMDRYGEGSRDVATLNLYWSARIAEGAPEPADDVAELRFFPPDEIPRADLAFAHIADVISVWRRRNEHA
ncbi:MAG: NUDIX domain-containing protein [Actinomycetota bacterium]|nr:NUDIX domain-containing protein [Actinomycetota bacterium]